MISISDIQHYQKQQRPELAATSRPRFATTRVSPLTPRAIVVVGLRVAMVVATAAVLAGSERGWLPKWFHAPGLITI